jgi:hypothetical protein
VDGNMPILAQRHHDAIEGLLTPICDQGAVPKRLARFPKVAGLYRVVKEYAFM